LRSQKVDDIKKALEEAIAEQGGDSETLEKVMRTLDSKKILRYHKEDEISLLSTAGRVLVALIEDPNMTVRAISVYLDLSETMIEKTVKQLINAGLITKTKVNRQNVYRCNDKSILSQRDIQNFFAAITLLSNPNSTDEVTETGSDTSPF
jgi:DNA-binding transcriptional regulator GbsR (MarR family)